MKENNDKRLVKVVIESFVIRNEEGIGLYRTSTHEGAERKLNELCERYRQPTHPFKPSIITKERAIVECEVVRRRYSKSCRFREKAGKTVYRLYHDDDLVKELDHAPKPMDVINAYAYNVNWAIIE